jgi:hypothetical protein
MKKQLFAVAAVVLMAVVAQAGEIKFHEWPTAPIPQEITTIPVVMDIGFWVRIKDQNNLRIKLNQDAIHTYSGCTNAVVETNTCLTFSCSIARVNAPGGGAVVPGNYSCSVSPANIDAPGGTLTVCARITDADLSRVPGGTKNVHVANVTVRVVPRACPS